MKGNWLLSRVKLRRDASIAALLPLLNPSRPGAGHHLLWSLFADGPTRKRDFLWRETRPGSFIVLSPRTPADRHDLFEIESKQFEPALVAGDCLAFSLRANPTIARRPEGATHSKRHDVVMNTIRPAPRGARARSRDEVIWQAGQHWLSARAARCGFSLPSPAKGSDLPPGLRIGGYRVEEIAQAGGKSVTVARLDFDGVLTVEDPERFVTSITTGIGPAKAYGCGLLLVRRASRA